MWLLVECDRLALSGQRHRSCRRTTLELTGRAFNAITDKLTMTGMLTRAPVQ
jgi:hypothetical protein